MQAAPRNVVRWLAIAALASAVVSAVLVVIGDGPAVVRALRGFDPLTLVWMLLLGAVGFLVRSLRWGALMRVVGHPVSLRDALYLQVSGQAMTVTPGRVGEVVKPWLARELSGMRMTRGVTLVFAERVADLIAVCLLALGGLWALGGATWVLGAGIAVVVAGTALAGSSWFHGLALRFVRGRERARKHEASAEVIAKTLRRALQWRVLAWSVPASIVAWGLEGVGFVLCLSAFGFDVLGALTGVSIYAVATIAGAFSFLPGGIGLTEASMAGILVAAGMPAASAAGATVVTRVATLWWGVALGWIALASRPGLLKRVLGQSQYAGRALCRRCPGRLKRPVRDADLLGRLHRLPPRRARSNDGIRRPWRHDVSRRAGRSRRRVCGLSPAHRWCDLPANHRDE